MQKCGSFRTAWVGGRRLFGNLKGNSCEKTNHPFGTFVWIMWVFFRWQKFWVSKNSFFFLLWPLITEKKNHVLNGDLVDYGLRDDLSTIKERYFQMHYTYWSWTSSKLLNCERIDTKTKSEKKIQLIQFNKQLGIHIALCELLCVYGFEVMKWFLPGLVTNTKLIEIHGES